MLTAPPVAAQRDRVDWLRQHSVPLRTMAAESTDFSDLEPLVAKLAGVRVVQLAELSHGDGNGSAARVRLIKFLHQRLGFSVVVWEAGFYEAERMNTLLATDAPLFYAPSAALWGFWSESAQITPLFAYARERMKTGLPLRMAGFDVQFTGGVPALHERLRDLTRWFARAGSPLPAPLHAVLDSTRQRLSRNSGGMVPARDTLLAYASALVAHFESNAAAMRTAHGALGAARIERVLRNMLEYRQMLAYHPNVQADSLQAFATSYSARDRANADNLLWLVNEAYRDAKLIVWLHNVHAAHTRLGARFESLQPADAAGSLESTGRLVKLALGDALYSIGTTAYDGQWGFPDQPGQLVPKSPPGALVELLSQLGHSFALVDLRAARTPGHWLLQPMPGSLSAQVQDRWYPIVWPQVFDGLLFIQRMTPAERAR
ncbi:MAG: erythromycin esterase family protein [Longimicrobiales bacterium]